MPPICSILIPSRGRIAKLERTIQSFIEKARDRSRIEILVKLDEDDALSIARIPALKDMGVIVVVTPRLEGYCDLHRFYGILAELSHGDWIWLFNDDAFMSTANWDTLLIQFGDATTVPMVLIPWVDGPPEYPAEWLQKFYDTGWHNDFPLVSRRLFEFNGRFSVSPANDCYWHDLQLAFPILHRECRELVVIHTYDRDETHTYDNAASNRAMEIHYSSTVRRSYDEVKQKLKLIL